FEDALAKRGYLGRGLNVVARMNNMEAIKQAVAAGLGVSIVSKMAVGDHQPDSGMRVFSIEGFKDEREFYFAYHKNVSLSPVAEAFKTYVLEKCLP
ncbi:MAG: LysR substrate-binding domain-containing protein, partial [Anaerovorax sp.]